MSYFRLCIHFALKFRILLEAVDMCGRCTAAL